MKPNKILVISHERSGTHFLMNSIALNFDYASEWVDMDVTKGLDFRDSGRAKKWFSRFDGQHIRNIFKSHHDQRLYAPLIPDLLEEFHIFYVVREGRDVMTSFWRYLNTLRPGWGPQAPSVGEFMRISPSGGLLQYQYRPNATMLERWVGNVEHWVSNPDGIHIISYQDLYLQFEDTIQRIAGILGKEAGEIRRPGLNAPGSVPWKGGIGNWRNFFSDQDEAYFMTHAGEISERISPTLGSGEL